MHRDDYIHIAPKPCRIPRQSFNERTVQQKLRVLAFWLLFGAACWGLVWWRAR